MNANEAILQATKSDTSEIADFLAHADCIHRHLDWQGVLDWIPERPFLILKKEGRLKGLLACPPDLEKIAWIRCFACTNQNELPFIWNKLFQSICGQPDFSGITLYSVGLHDWFSEILTNANFENFQNIVILYWNRKLPTIDPPNPSVILRPMELTDLPQVAFLDKIAFESMWVNPREKISLAFNQAEHAYVADFDGQIIGYEMTTANFFSAHLARIAIHPNFQKQHIGSELICEMFKYFRRKGIDQISVNTQNTNKSSLALYKSLGFELSEESFPVFRFRI